MIRVAVHISNHPPIGTVTDTDSQVTLILHKVRNAWIPIAAIKPGEAVPAPPPPQLALPGPVLDALNRFPTHSVTVTGV